MKLLIKERLKLEQFKTPILFVVFNREESTKRVFEVIKKVRPINLYISSDGPREYEEGEREKVARIRDYIAKNISWPCNFRSLFHHSNLGCKNAVTEGIDWFFENEESGIILEDDCVPNQSFFEYCDELLKLFKSEMRIWHIGGNNYNYPGKINNSFSIVRFAQVWGWATWANRWAKYRKDLKPLLKNLDLNDFCESTNLSIREAREVINRIEKASSGEIDTWDYQWQGVVLLNKGLCVVPRNNMITNIGTGSDATHTKSINANAHLKIQESEFPLTYPKEIIPHVDLENYFKKRMGIKLSRFRSFKRKLRKLIK